MYSKLITRFLLPLCLGILITNLLVNFFVYWSVENLQLPGYFYLPIDWEKKLLKAQDSTQKNQIAFLGSSRTAYIIDPKKFKSSNVINLGLVASSILEQNEVASKVIASNPEIKEIWLEINPMGLTKRHMDAAEIAGAMEELYHYNKIEYSVKKYVYEWPLLKYSKLFPDLVKSVKNLNFKPKENNYINEKNTRFSVEFSAIAKKDYLGYIGGIYTPNLEFRNDLKRECETMLRWSLSESTDDLTKGLVKLELLLNSLINSGKIVKLWLPPKTNFYKDIAAKHEEKVLNFITKKYPQLRIFDSNFLIQGNEEEYFIDCIHTNEFSSKQLSVLLHQELK